MLGYSAALGWLIAFAGIFTAAGIWSSRRGRGDFEDFVVARNSQGTISTSLTMVASALGAWILFAPAESATWGGVGAVGGYAIGSMSPYIAMIFLGRRMRQLIPRGHTLSEYVLQRYGRAMYGVVLAVMLLYLFIALTAEITAIALLVSLIAPIPHWLTSAVVLGATLIYTAWGGLRASIFTDKVQMIVITPLLFILIFLGWRSVGDINTIVHQLRINAPDLISLSDVSGLKAGLTFMVAILFTDIFHQGYWQRIYAARSPRAMQHAFLLCGIVIVPVIFILGLFGLVFVANGGEETHSSVALFSVILSSIPTWFTIALIPLGLSLVMSSADTAISAIASIIAVDSRHLLPKSSSSALMRLSRIAIFLIALPIWFIAAKGYSVLYLFLLADLFCSAAAFPVFIGLYSQRYTGRTALFSLLSGLTAGLLLFPSPEGNMDNLLYSFLLASLLPALISFVALNFRRYKPR